MDERLVEPPSLVKRLSFNDPTQLSVRRAKQRGRVAIWLAVAWMALAVGVALFADVLPLRRYDIIVGGLEPRLSPRFSFTEPIGTDVLGRSVASRLAYGGRQTLIVGLVSTLVAMIVGTAIGLMAGYFRGKISAAIGVVIDALLAIPPLVLLLAIAAVGKRDLTTVIVGISVVATPTFVRLARANALALVERESVTAARAMGASHTWIMSRELLPSVLLPVLSFAFLFMGFVVVAEATLSFLGLGIPPPTPSWGGMINDSRGYLESAPHLVFIPAFCILFTVVSFTVIGDRARRQFDVRESALS